MFKLQFLQLQLKELSRDCYNWVFHSPHWHARGNGEDKAYTGGRMCKNEKYTARSAGRINEDVQWRRRMFKQLQLKEFSRDYNNRSFHSPHCHARGKGDDKAHTRRRICKNGNYTARSDRQSKWGCEVKKMDTNPRLFSLRLQMCCKFAPHVCVQHIFQLPINLYRC